LIIDDYIVRSPCLENIHPVKSTHTFDQTSTWYLSPRAPLHVWYS